MQEYKTQSHADGHGHCQVETLKLNRSRYKPARATNRNEGYKLECFCLTLSKLDCIGISWVVLSLEDMRDGLQRSKKLFDKQVGSAEPSMISMH